MFCGFHIHLHRDTTVADHFIANRKEAEQVGGAAGIQDFGLFRVDGFAPGRLVLVMLSGLQAFVIRVLSGLIRA